MNFRILWQETFALHGVVVKMKAFFGWEASQMMGGYLVSCSPSDAELRVVIQNMISSGKIVGKTVDDVMLNSDAYCQQKKAEATTEWHRLQEPRLRAEQQRQATENAMAASLRQERQRQAALEDVEKVNAQARQRQEQARRGRKRR